MDISAEEEAILIEQLRVLRIEEQEHVGTINTLKSSKAERSALLPEVEKLTAVRAKIDDVNRQLYPPERLDVNRAGLEELLKRRFFFCQSFSIHGGVSGLYDFGPPGCAIKANLLALWRQYFVLEENSLEIDTSCVTPYPVLDTSGHIEKFKDFMVKDTVTGTCFRADHLLEDIMEKKVEDSATTDEQRAEYVRIRDAAGNMEAEELTANLRRFEAVAPETNNPISDAYPFNLMFQTQIGPSGQHVGFLRPETAQGIFVNFARLLDFNNNRLPFAAATIGLAFRNEISPRNGLLRVREFTLAEIEHFVDPDNKKHVRFDSVRNNELTLYTGEAQITTRRLIKMTIGEAVEKRIVDNETLGYYMARVNQFLTEAGVRRLRFRQHKPKEMAHYAKDCWDAEILTTYGWVECVGIADRECFDLSHHNERTGARLHWFREFPDGPRTIEVNKPVLNKGLIGGQFKKEASLVFSYFEHASEEEKAAVQAALEANGEATITSKTCEGKQFTLTPKMLSFKKETVKSSGEPITPGVIEPSFGIGRIIYSILEHSYYVREDDAKRGVLRFPPAIAPVKCSVLPLTAHQSLQPFVSEIDTLLTSINVSHKVDDVGQSIGRRYARTDEIGIPFGVTIDFRTVEDRTVTVRERDSTLQVRVPIADLASLMSQLVRGLVEWDVVRSRYEHVEPAAE